MDDLTAFERLVADEVRRIVGPARPVDDRAILAAIAANAVPSRVRRVPPLLNTLRFMVATALVLAFAAILTVVVPRPPGDVPAPGVGGAASSPPSPTLAPIAIEDAGPRSDVLMTSERFRPRVAFVLRGINGMHGEETDWCPDVSTSERVLVLRWLYSCGHELRLIRPFAVDCGTADEHPDAAELAAAILATPGNTQISDLGDLSAFAVLTPQFDLSGNTGRVLWITTTPSGLRVPSESVRCQLLPEPGSADRMFEARAANSMLVLMDVDGELVVLQVPGMEGSDGVPSYVLDSFRSFRFID